MAGGQQSPNQAEKELKSKQLEFNKTIETIKRDTILADPA